MGGHIARYLRLVESDRDSSEFDSTKAVIEHVYEDDDRAPVVMDGDKPSQRW